MRCVAWLVKELHQVVCVLVFVMSGELLLQFFELDWPQARQMTGKGAQIILTVLVNEHYQLDG